MNNSTTLGLHLALGLFVVFAVMAILTALVRRTQGRRGRGRKAPTIETLARVSLSKSTSVAVLRVGERELLVGVGGNNVSILAETEIGVLTGAGRLTIDMRDATPAAAVPATVAAQPLPAQPLPAARQEADLPENWWPTLVEQLRDRTSRTTRELQR